MSDNFYFVAPEQIEGAHLSLDQDESRHLCAVLRKSVGDIFWAVDGLGKAYECQLLKAEKSEPAEARIIQTVREFGEPRFRLTLAVAIPKKDKFEWIIEKATELGVVSVVPLLTSRTVMTAKSVKPERCRKIVLSAMKQCRRSRMLHVHEPVAFDMVLRQTVGSDLKLVAHEKAGSTSMLDCLSEIRGNAPATGMLCIGPEGGFSEEEIELATGRDYRIAGLGRRRLRTETAAILASGLVLAEMGELSSTGHARPAG